MPFTIGGDWISNNDGKKNTNKQKKIRPVKVRTEKRGKGIVTVILNLNYSSNEMKNLAKEIKKKCGCGGTVKEGVIEIQGDKITIIRQELRNKGIKAQ